jgi:hypothetical protein
VPDGNLIGNVVAGFSPRSAFAKATLVPERTRAKARDYITEQYLIAR